MPEKEIKNPAMLSCHEIEDQELEEMLNRAHQSGLALGLMRSATHIMDAAKNDFQDFGGGDRTACRLRSLARELYELYKKSEYAKSELKGVE